MGWCRVHSRLSFHEGCEEARKESAHHRFCLCCLKLGDIMSSLTPNSDKVFINKKAPRLSVEYAKARNAIYEDYKLLFASNQAMAKRVKKEHKDRAVNYLEGKVAWA